MKRIKRVSDNRWEVWNAANQKSAVILRLEDPGMFGSGKFYRVDVAGKTIDTMLSSYQTARSIAYKQVS